MTAFGAGVATFEGGEQGGTGRMKRVAFSILGPTSYDTGGSLIDLSSTGGLGAEWGFNLVHGVQCAGMTPVASHKYVPCYLRAAAGAPATGKVTLYDHTLHPGAQVAATEALDATTFHFVAWGY